ncbi:MAG: hypothetical protein J6333_04660 [Planctomycetes bacterium]|nr:hypothetical protein [Planctomycetota bacterium]
MNKRIIIILLAFVALSCRQINLAADGNPNPPTLTHKVTAGKHEKEEVYYDQGYNRDVPSTELRIKLETPNVFLPNDKTAIPRVVVKEMTPSGRTEKAWGVPKRSPESKPETVKIKGTYRDTFAEHLQMSYLQIVFGDVCPPDGGSGPCDTSFSFLARAKSNDEYIWYFIKPKGFPPSEAPSESAQSLGNSFFQIEYDETSKVYTLDIDFKVQIDIKDKDNIGEICPSPCFEVEAIPSLDTWKWDNGAVAGQGRGKRFGIARLAPAEKNAVGAENSYVVSAHVKISGEKYDEVGQIVKTVKFYANSKVTVHGFFSSDGAGVPLV